MIKIKIPFKTPTINHLYGFRGVQRYLKPEAKKMKVEIKELVAPHKGEAEQLKNKGLVLTVEIHEDWYTKKGEVKRKDLSNREKFLVDSIFEALGLDDKFIFMHLMEKVQDMEEFAIVNLKEILK